MDYYNNESFWIPRLLWLIKVKNSYITIYKMTGKERRRWGRGGFNLDFPQNHVFRGL
jgi:predicted transposase YbfD/YdcC